MIRFRWQNRWHSSLYWRAAFSCVLLVSGLVAAQLGMSYWLLVSDEAARAVRRDLTLSVATRLGLDLTNNPQLDVAEYFRAVHATGDLFVIMRDGRVIGTDTPPPEIVQLVVVGLRNPALTSIPSSWRSSGYSAAPVMVNGNLVGVLGLLRPTTFEENRVLIIGLGVCALVFSAILTAVLAFRPTKRRLRDLERAARRLEAGDLSARAGEAGSDEVTQLARAFNSMAGALMKHADERQASDRSRRQLMADISHELMTPVTAIRGYLETLAMVGIKMDAFTRQKQVTVARRETQRLERLIGDLLDTTRLEAGGGRHFERCEIRVSELFERVVEHHEPESRAKGTQCRQSVSPLAQTVTADPFRLEQALVNVTTNAFRHTPDKGLVELRSELADGMIVLSVTDSGEGIPSEHLPLIFDRFHRVPSSRANPSGSGLGLAIVKAIVEGHGGFVKAASVPGSGTTISLAFPVQEPRTFTASALEDVSSTA